MAAHKLTGKNDTYINPMIQDKEIITTGLETS